MQDLTARDEANKRDTLVGETVYVDAYQQRGVVLDKVVKYGQTSYTIELEGGVKTRRLRREFIRVIQ